MIVFNSFMRLQEHGRTVLIAGLADLIAVSAHDLARSGFTDVLWPPLCKAQGGAADNADGYGLLDNYDIGSKDQAYSKATRWGTAEQLRRAISVVRANGMGNLADLVIHQYDGGNNKVYRYPSATGKDNGRFPKDPMCFVGPGVPVDDVFDPQGNMAFGDLVSYQHSKPQGYMKREMIAAAVWQRDTLNLDGFRIDDTKGENVSITQELRKAVGGYCFGECFTGNPGELESWIRQTNGSTATLDFTLHFALQAVCDNNASFRILDGAGFVAVDPAHAVTFVDTADTDSNNSENIKFNKLWAYLIILMGQGTPLVYARDYLAAPGCYGLKPHLDNLMWISRNFAFGGQQTRFVDDSCYVFTRDGNGGNYGWSGGLLVGLNRDPVNSRTVTVQTTFGPNAWIHNYAEGGGDTRTDQYGRATIIIPPNSWGGGQSYVCFARGGVESSLAYDPDYTTQTFYGDFDLDIGPLENAIQDLPCRLWMGAKTTYMITLLTTIAATTGFAVINPSGQVVGTASSPHKNVHLSGMAKEEGWYTIQLTGSNLPAPLPYELYVTYKASQTLPEGA